MKRDDVEIRDQIHLMDAEGRQADEPSETEIKAVIEGEGFLAKNVRKQFDELQNDWAWSCDIQKI